MKNQPKRSRIKPGRMTVLSLTLAVWCLGASTIGSSAVEIVAHRGASFDAPENTLPAFKLGWKQGADAVELDIWLSKDGQIVVLHDPNTKRIAGQDKKVSEQTLAELRGLDAGRWKDAKWAGEKLPTLDEALNIIPDGKQLFIEIKCGAEVLPELERALKQAAKKPQQIVIIGFSLPTMEAAKKRFPNLQVFWLSDFKKDKETGAWSPTVDELIRGAVAAKLDGLDLKAETEVLDAAFAQKIRAARLQFHVWTVDDPAIARKMVQIGVDGITTNRPEWLRQQLK
jgi:glycerophosphoryl diester phosphodiesterase